MDSRVRGFSKDRLVQLAVDYIWGSETAQKFTPDELLALLTFMRDEKRQKVPNFPQGFPEAVQDLGYDWWQRFPGCDVGGNPFFYFYGDCAVRMRELVRSGKIDPRDPKFGKDYDNLFGGGRVQISLRKSPQ